MLRGRRRGVLELLILLAALSCASDSLPSEGIEADDSTYRIQVGDRLSIKVLYHAELDVRDAVVQEDGAVVVPKLDRVAVAGRTLAEAQHVIQEGLRQYRAYRHAIVLMRRLRSADEGE